MTEKYILETRYSRFTLGLILIGNCGSHLYATERLCLPMVRYSRLLKPVLRLFILLLTTRVRELESIQEIETLHASNVDHQITVLSGVFQISMKRIRRTNRVETGEWYKEASNGYRTCCGGQTRNAPECDISGFCQQYCERLTTRSSVLTRLARIGFRLTCFIGVLDIFKS